MMRMYKQRVTTTLVYPHTDIQGLRTDLVGFEVAVWEVFLIQCDGDKLNCWVDVSQINEDHLMIGFHCDLQNLLTIFVVIVCTVAKLDFCIVGTCEI